MVNLRHALSAVTVSSLTHLAFAATTFGIDAALEPVAHASAMFNSTFLDPLMNATFTFPIGIRGVASAPGPAHVAAADIKKRGVAWGWGDKHISGDLRALSPGFTWWYTWSATGSTNAAADLRTSQDLGVEYVAMQWANWGIENLHKEAAATAQTQSLKTLLGFNEPNHKEQANLTPKQAAELWPQLVQVAQDMGLRLGSPSPATCGENCITTSPFDWMDQWIGNCTAMYKDGCAFDFTTTHFYSCNVEYMSRFLEEYHAKYKKPVWLTEFACPLGRSTDVGRQVSFMRDALRVMDSASYVERYNWFTTRCDPNDGWLGPTICLLDPASEASRLTYLGRFYTGKASAADMAYAANLGSSTAALAPAMEQESWSQICGNCTSRHFAGVRNGPTKVAAVTHCKDCGYASISGVYAKTNGALAPAPSIGRAKSLAAPLPG